MDCMFSTMSEACRSFVYPEGELPELDWRRLGCRASEYSGTVLRCVLDTVPLVFSSTVLLRLFS